MRKDNGFSHLYIPCRIPLPHFVFNLEVKDLNKLNKKFDSRRMVMLAVFCAIAFATMFVLRIKVNFLTFDAKDTVILIAAMLFGPSAGVIISLVVATLEMITVSDTGIYGFIMNFVSSAVFSVVASVIYRRAKNMLSAVLGLVCGVLSVTSVMMLLNLLIVPLYTPGVDANAVAGMIPTLLLPFNLTKSSLNAALVAALYKPVSSALKKARFIEGKDSGEYKLRGKSLVFLIVSVLVVIACLLVLFLVLDGSFSLFREIGK
jgi:riboflavin transporter FmnP